MGQVTIGIVAVAMLLGAGTPAMARDCRGSAADKVAIEASVAAFYKGLATQDRALFERPLAPDFVAIEVGEYYTPRRLFDDIADLMRQGRRYEWNVGAMTIAFDCRTAWAHWETTGQSGVPPKMRPRRWLESGVFRRVANGGWQMALFHSTPAPDAK